MSKLYFEIEKKASELLGDGQDAINDAKLTAASTAAAEALRGRLRKNVDIDEIRELFTTSAAMLAAAMYLELSAASDGEISGFTAGRLAVQLGGGSIQVVRKSAEDMLAAYTDGVGFAFAGVQG